MADLGKQIKAKRRQFSLMDALSSLADQTGRIRYGVPTSVKERLARMRALPGAPEVTADAEEADRYAAGHLFGREHPMLSEKLQPLVSMLKTSDLPLLGGSSPELQSYADAGARAGRLEAENRRRR